MTLWRHGILYHNHCYASYLLLRYGAVYTQSHTSVHLVDTRFSGMLWQNFEGISLKIKIKFSFNPRRIPGSLVPSLNSGKLLNHRIGFLSQIFSKWNSYLRRVRPRIRDSNRDVHSPLSSQKTWLPRPKPLVVPRPVCRWLCTASGSASFSRAVASCLSPWCGWSTQPRQEDRPRVW